MAKYLLSVWLMSQLDREARTIGAETEPFETEPFEYDNSQYSE